MTKSIDSAVWIAMVPVLIAVVALAQVALVGLIQYKMARLVTAVDETKARVEETKARVDEVAVHTNSMKDALVKVTGEAEFAKGLKQGVEEATGTPTSLASAASPPAPPSTATRD